MCCQLQPDREESKRASSCYRWVSGAYQVSAQNIYPYVARLSQLGTGDEILKGKGDLETL